MKNKRSGQKTGKKITGMQFLASDTSKLLITSNDSRIRLYDGAALNNLLLTRDICYNPNICLSSQVVMLAMHAPLENWCCAAVYTMYHTHVYSVHCILYNVQYVSVMCVQYSVQTGSLYPHTTHRHSTAEPCC